jgi:lipopolysaccharide export LptBFGC system permease protein LptF
VTPTSDIGQNAQAAHGAYRDCGRINLRLYATLATTVVAIGLCFIALPFTPKLAVSSWAPRILILSVGLGIVCLLLYVWLIYAMVKRPE